MAGCDRRGRGRVMADNEEVDFSNIVTDSVFEEADEYMTPVLMVDNILKAKSKADAAYCLIEFIDFLYVKRPESEQAAICGYAKMQAYSYRPDFLDVLAASMKQLTAEVARRGLKADRKARKR